MMVMMVMVMVVAGWQELDPWCTASIWGLPHRAGESSGFILLLGDIFSQKSKSKLELSN